jgi:hypothetical protein
LASTLINGSFCVSIFSSIIFIMQT